MTASGWQPATMHVACSVVDRQPWAVLPPRIKGPGMNLRLATQGRGNAHALYIGRGNFRGSEYPCIAGYSLESPFSVVTVRRDEIPHAHPL